MPWFQGLIDFGLVPSSGRLSCIYSSRVINEQEADVLDVCLRWLRCDGMPKGMDVLVGLRDVGSLDLNHYCHLDTVGTPSPECKC